MNVIDSGQSSMPSPSTVYQLLSRASAANPDRIAITFIEDADTLVTSTLTHAQFIARLHQMVHLFIELGVRRTNVISILSPNVADAMIAFFAAETVGIVNPINFLLRPDEVIAMMKAVNTKVLITVGPDAPDLWKATENLKTQVASLEHIVAIGAAPKNTISFTSALAGRPTIPPPSELLPVSGDVAAYFHTGGTTGSPKIALHSHRNQVFSAESLADSWLFDNETRALNGMPIFHVAGSLLLGLGPLGRGGEVILPTATGFRNQRVIANYWNLIEKLKITVGGGIPTTLVSLLCVPIGSSDISSLKFFMTGGTYLPPPIAKSIKDQFGIVTRQLYVT